MRSLAVLTGVAVALVLSALAFAGGWAAVGFEPLPDGTKAGETWHPTIFVKQHGVTPLAGLQPVVTIEAADSKASETFFAEPGTEAGVYEADVVFPDPGDWRVTIHSGFGDSQVSYGPVAIGPPGTGGDSRPHLIVGLGIVAIAVVGALGLLVARRSRRLSPARG